MDISIVLLLSFIGGAATLLGGLAYAFIHINKRLLQFVTIATTGALLSVIMLGLLPISVRIGGAGYAALGFLLGGMLFMISGSVFPHTYGAEKYEDKLYSLLKSNSLIVMGVIIFNIPAGLLMGAGFASSVGMGAGILLAVMLQNIARGIGISLPLHDSTMGRARTAAIMVLAGVPAAAGAGLAFAVLAGAAPVVLASGAAFSAGAMFFVCSDQLVAMLKTYNRPHELAASLFFGVCIGVLLLAIA